MSAFQPILACFLSLVIVNIAVKGMAVVTKRSVMCSNKATTSKLHMIRLFKKWGNETRESTCLDINLSHVRQYFVFVLNLLLFLLYFCDYFRS